MATLQGFAAESAYLRGLLNTGWNGATPIAWDGAAFAPPDGPWLRYSLQHFPDARLASIGTGQMWRHDGNVVLEIFVPVGPTAEQDANEYADSASAIFRGVRADGLRFYNPTRIRVGVQGQWFKLDVLCPFQRDTVFT